LPAIARLADFDEEGTSRRCWALKLTLAGVSLEDQLRNERAQHRFNLAEKEKEPAIAL
jgi:hypothetical protein